MGRIEMDGLTLAELKQLQKDVTKAIDTFEDRQRQHARLTLEAQAREMGFTLNDLVDGTRKSSKKVNPPKYRHPENPEMTWSGRGRQPGWVKDILSNGDDLGNYLIS